MLNAIKMELYRMFHTKSLYVIWAIMITTILLTMYLTKSEYDEMVSQQEVTQETVEQEDNTIQVGIQVALPTEPSEKVTIQDLVFADTQGKPVALFIVIFTVIFSMADMNSGYIKNIGGQVAKRRELIGAKAVALITHVILSMGLYAVTQIITSRIYFGYTVFGNVEMLCKYWIIQVMLHIALSLLCMTIALLIRNNVISMMIVICLCMNVLTIFYSLIDRGLSKIFTKDFQILNYTITGKISLLPMNVTNNEAMGAIMVAAIFIIATMAISCIVFEKRDIV